MGYLIFHMGICPGDAAYIQHSFFQGVGVISSVIKSRIEAGKVSEAERIANDWRRRMCVMV